MFMFPAVKLIAPLFVLTLTPEETVKVFPAVTVNPTPLLLKKTSSLKVTLFDATSVTLANAFAIVAGSIVKVLVTHLTQIENPEI
jgi:hypothetical protein